MQNYERNGPVLPTEFLKEFCFEAVKKGRKDIIEYLIKKQHVNMKAKDTFNRILIRIACINGHINIVKYLIEQQHTNKEARDNSGWTSLHFARQNSHLNIVEYLIEKQPIVCVAITTHYNMCAWKFEKCLLSVKESLKKYCSNSHNELNELIEVIIHMDSLPKPGSKNITKFDLKCHAKLMELCQNLKYV